MDREKWFQPSSEWIEEERSAVIEGLRSQLEHKSVQGSRLSGTEALEYFDTLLALCKEAKEILEVRRGRILQLSNFTHAPSK